MSIWFTATLLLQSASAASHRPKRLRRDSPDPSLSLSGRGHGCFLCGYRRTFIKKEPSRQDYNVFVLPIGGVTVARPLWMHYYGSPSESVGPNLPPRDNSLATCLSCKINETDLFDNHPYTRRMVTTCSVVVP